MKEGENEREDDFNKRCRQVWKKLCDKADKQGNIQCEDEERDDDGNEDCEGDIEEAVKEAVEEVDREEAIALSPPPLAPQRRVIGSVALHEWMNTHTGLLPELIRRERDGRTYVYLATENPNQAPTFPADIQGILLQRITKA